MADDCTGFPEAVAGVVIAGCCRIHDAAYAAGGNLIDFLKANIDLGACVAALSDRPVLLAVGILMAAGTTLFGLPFWIRARRERYRLKHLAEVNDGHPANHARQNQRGEEALCRTKATVLSEEVPTEIRQ